MFKALFIF